MNNLVTQSPLEEMYTYAEWLEIQVSLYEFAQEQTDESEEINKLVQDNVWDLFED